MSCELENVKFRDMADNNPFKNKLQARRRAKAWMVQTIDPDADPGDKYPKVADNIEFRIAGRHWYGVANVKTQLWVNREDRPDFDTLFDMNTCTARMFTPDGAVDPVYYDLVYDGKGTFGGSA